MQALWFWLVAVMVALYAVFDGYDFGVGILHRFVAKRDDERRAVLASIGPFWDGNEVWLIASGGALFVAFPKVLAAGFSGFYLAMFLVLLALLMRGISIEFRSHLENGLWRAFWDSGFVVSSALLPLLLGVALGNVVRGVPLDANGEFNLPLFTNFGTTGNVGILDYYTVLVGIYVVLTVTMHGALFLTWKTQGEVHHRARRLVLPLWIAVVVTTVGVTITTAQVSPAVFVGFGTSPLAWLAACLYLGAFVAVLWFHRTARWLSALIASGAFILGLLVVVAASVFPVMLRSTIDPAFSLTAYNASVSAVGLRAGAYWWFLGFPLAIGYVVFLQYLHRGKATAARDREGY